jgi:hypothetical protein
MSVVRRCSPLDDTGIPANCMERHAPFSKTLAERLRAQMIKELGLEELAKIKTA